MSDDKKKSELDQPFTEIDFDNQDELDVLKSRAEALIQEDLSRRSSVAEPVESLITPSISIVSTAASSSSRPASDLDKYKQDKKNYVSGDNLLAMIRQGNNSFSLLDKVIEEIAEENANLKFERENESVDPIKASKTRAAILKTIGDLLVTKRELAQTQNVNLHSKRLQAVFKYIITIVKTSLDQTDEIMPEQKELFFSKLIKNMEGFEDKAEAIMAKIEEE